MALDLFAPAAMESKEERLATGAAVLPGFAAPAEAALLAGNEWPPMPESFLRLAVDAAAHAGFSGFVPDACLLNRYEPGARMSLHQDKNERDFDQPIVSVSLGLPAVFLFGGFKRADKPRRVELRHGDVTVWGGPSRLRYHGVMPLRDGLHPVVGRHRINLTLRRAA